MKYNLLLVIITILSILFGCTENNPKYGKRCTIYDYQYKSGRIDLESKRLLESRTFDSKNHIIEQIFYREVYNENWFARIMNRIYGLQDEYYNFEYNKNGQLTLIEGYRRNGKLKTKTLYQYDNEGNKGNKVKEISFITKDRIDKKFSIYYKNKYSSTNKRNVLAIDSYNWNGVLLNKSKFDYNSAGNTFTETYYNPKGTYDKFKENYYPYPVEIQSFEVNKSKWVKSINQYDCKGKILKRIVHYEDEKFDFKTTYSYDKNGNNVEQVWYNKSNYYQMKEAYIRGNNKNSISEKLQFPKMDRKYIAKYDSFSKIIEEVWYNEFGFIILKISYEYDSRGNMISKILYNKFNLPTYKIEYIYN